MGTDKDAILEALDMLDDWVMDRILNDKGEKPPDEQSEPGEPGAEAELDLAVEPDADEAGGAPDGDDDDSGEPKMSVLRRYDFAGAKPAPKQDAGSLEEEMMKRKVPVAKRR